jgi:ADP-ribosylglycohydrolase
MSTNSFEEAIINAINKGDDADTVGAVTGMIAGRVYGLSQPPRMLTGNLKLTEVGKRLLAHR